ncbi:MAG: hypothetical protein ACRECQ_13655 [Burkholderiaceae bacterium]
MKHKVFAVAVMLSLGVSAAFAADSARTEKRGARVAKLDTNGDGQISREEAATAPRLAQRFDRIDANKDGQITRDEFASARSGRPGASPRVKP